MGDGEGYSAGVINHADWLCFLMIISEVRGSKTSQHIILIVNCFGSFE